MADWYQREWVDVLDSLGVKLENGLSNDEARHRLEQYGPNELADKGGKSVWAILGEQLTGLMTVILIVSAVVSLILGDYEDAIAILVIVVLNTALGFTQEYRAEKAMAALKKMTVPQVKVRRDGHILEISSRDLVQGDLVFLEAGNSVTGDGRIVESVNMRVQESVLTGESDPVEKVITSLPHENLALGDQRNRIFMGTIVTYGRGLAVITETGMQTELGKIASMLQDVKQESTPLQRRLEQLARGLAVAALVVIAIVLVLGILRGEEFRLMLMTAISLAVAAVPEGLPTVVTIGLAFGAQRMLGRKALIRRLPAVETLGSVTVICSDKTGTLTENRMTVTFIDVADHQLNLNEELQDFSPTVTLADSKPSMSEHPAISLLLKAGALCNDAAIEPQKEDPSQYTSVGDPTEGALVIAAARAGLWKNELEQALPRKAELPFDSDRKRMTTVHLRQDNSLTLPAQALITNSKEFPYIAFTKGAVDSLLEVSNQVLVNDTIYPMNETWLERIRGANNRMAQNGMRVLGAAYRLQADIVINDPADPLENDLVFIGMVGIIDPVRPEVHSAVKTAQSAGIRPIMITGDHPLTALYIAKELGIASNTKVLTGRELAVMSVADLSSAVLEVSVFARVSPEHKLKIVQALQTGGQIVAMTGDGVNDAPALKKADIGVAMGISGTDVSKESSDMVLLNDNFATIVAAIEEGRRIYDNIRKFIKYALGSNTGEILVMLVAPFLGMPLPLTPLQILWVNLVTDGLPGLALSMEAAEKNVMKRPPLNPKESIFSQGIGRNILWVGTLLGAVTVGIGFWGWSTGQEAWQTMAFTTLTLAQMGNVLAIRSGRESIFTLGLLSNKPLLGSILLTVVLQIVIIYVPFMQSVFQTTALSSGQLLTTLAASSSIFLAVEIEKWLFRRSEKK